MRAVVFTHFPIHEAETRAPLTPDSARELTDKARRCIRRYLACPNIGLVYVYVDAGVRFTLEHLRERGGLPSSPFDELELEENIHNCLKLAADLEAQAARDGHHGPDPIELPRFQFVGIRHLLSLIRSLYGIDPAMVEDLAGPNRQFTYDSPKFVEAIIRLVRGVDPDLAQHPVLRFDDDVLVNPDAIDRLLSQIADAQRTAPGSYHFFSGGYGTMGEPLDPLNDRAVRTHWLYDFERQVVREEYLEFLRDLGEFAATQLPAGEPMSKAVEAFVEEVRGGVSANRNVQQVISGAGLYMSRLAIQTLPPFMNLADLTLWVDDHLKRRLHETLRHIGSDAIEHVPDTLVSQNRHPNGVEPRDIEWAQSHYFDRILRGCMLHALVVGADGVPGILSRSVKRILDEPRKFELDGQLKAEIVAVSQERASELLNLWSEYSYGSHELKEWAKSHDDDRHAIAQSMAEDAFAYLRLVRMWPQYVMAIEKLQRFHAYWLFREV